MNNSSEHQERSAVGQAVDVSFAADQILNPLNEEPRERRLEASEWLIQGMMQRPGAAETMLWPVVHSVLLEEDEEIAEHSLKALRLIHDGSPELVCSALPLVANQFEPEVVVRSADALVAELNHHAAEQDPAVQALFEEGTLDMRAWAHTDFVAEIVQRKSSNSGFRRFQETDPAGASLALERAMDEAGKQFDWLNVQQGIVPRRWQKTKCIIDDLVRTRGIRLPEELLDAAVTHPQVKVARAAVAHHALTSAQQAEIIRRGDVKLHPNPETYFARREYQLNLDGRAGGSFIGWLRNRTE